MKMLVFAVYDSAVKAFNQPLFFRSKGEAVRSFTDACNDPSTGFVKHAADYSFFEIGEYDDASASFAIRPAPVRVITALECRVVDDSRSR